MLRPLAKARARSVEQPRPKQEQSIETHRNAHQQIPGAFVCAIPLDQCGMRFCGRREAMSVQLLRSERETIETGRPVAEEFSAAAAILGQAEVQNSRPMAFVDMDFPEALVGLEREPRFCVRLGRRCSDQALADNSAGRLSQPVDVDSLPGVASWKLPPLIRVIKRQCLCSQRFGIVEKVVDDEEGRVHRLQLGRRVSKGDGVEKAGDCEAHQSAAKRLRMTAATRSRSRSAARLAAVQALYQHEMEGTPLPLLLHEFHEHRLGAMIEDAQYHDAERDFFDDIVSGTYARLGEIDELIRSRLAQGWTLERLDRPMRAILRAGAYELIARGDVPVASVISEYVDVAHAFYDRRESGFVNGLLDAIAKEARS